MKYPFVFYVDKLAPGVGGEARGPVIRILKKYKDDIGIYKHELIHVKQWVIASIIGMSAIFLVWLTVLKFDPTFVLLGFLLHPLLYKFHHDYRLYCEVEAYKEQAKHYPDDRKKLFAEYISKEYNLNISESAAFDRLV